MWSNDRPTTSGFYWCHQHGKTRIVDIWCYKNGTELFTNEDGGASIKDTLYDDTQWMAAVIPPNPQDQNESTQPAPSVPDGWLRAIDEALVVANIGVANESDTYEQAKAKLDSLIGFHVDVATDPAVNGGWKLVPRPPTPTMVKAGLESSHVLNVHRVLACYDAMIDAAPEAKP